MSVPSPSDPPLLQRLKFLRDPIGYIDACQRKLGDVFSLRVFKRGMVLVCTPELAKEVFTAPDDVLVAGEAKIAIFGKLLGSASTVLLDGPAHVKRRRLMLPRFRGELMHAFGPAMIRACHRMFEKMPKHATFALHPYMHEIAFEVISVALLAETPAHRLTPLLARLREFANKAVTSRLLMIPALQKDLGPLSPWGRVLRIVERTRTAVLAEIAQRRRDNVNATDLLGLLMSARHDDGAPLTDIEIRDELMTMVAAGHETTAMALTWLCYAVFTRPAVLDKIVAELAANPGVDLDELPYLDAVVRESLRLYSVVPAGAGRLTKKPFQLGGHEIPAGSMITVAIHSVHRRASVYERPDEFLPERFLAKKFTPYEAAPFGGGSRRCLGMPFALYELKVVLATMVERIRLEVRQTAVKPSWRGTFLTPNKGLRVRAHAAPPIARVKPAAAARA